MGCAPSQPVASFNQFETHRKGLPGRVEIPADEVQGAWLCGTLGRALEVEGGYQVRCRRLPESVRSGTNGSGDMVSYRAGRSLQSRARRAVL